MTDESYVICKEIMKSRRHGLIGTHYNERKWGIGITQKEGNDVNATHKHDLELSAADWLLSGVERWSGSETYPEELSCEIKEADVIVYNRI